MEKYVKKNTADGVLLTQFCDSMNLMGVQISKPLKNKTNSIKYTQIYLTRC